MKGVLKKWLCGLILCCCIICSFSIDVYAGSDVDKLGEAELKRAESLYKYLIANGYSAQAAAGILGNADCETGFSESSARLDAAINAGSYSGYFQMANGVVQKDGSKLKMWEKFRNWCDKNNLDYRDITVQFRYFEETEMKDWSPYCEYPSTTEFKTCNDVF